MKKALISLVFGLMMFGFVCGATAAELLQNTYAFNVSSFGSFGTNNETRSIDVYGSTTDGIWHVIDFNNHISNSYESLYEKWIYGNQEDPYVFVQDSYGDYKSLGAEMNNYESRHSINNNNFSGLIRFDINNELLGKEIVSAKLKLYSYAYGGNYINNNGGEINLGHTYNPTQSLYYINNDNWYNNNQEYSEKYKLENNIETYTNTTGTNFDLPDSNSQFLATGSSVPYHQYGLQEWDLTDKIGNIINNPENSDGILSFYIKNTDPAPILTAPKDDILHSVNEIDAGVQYFKQIDLPPIILNPTDDLSVDTGAHSYNENNLYVDHGYTLDAEDAEADGLPEGTIVDTLSYLKFQVSSLPESQQIDSIQLKLYGKDGLAGYNSFPEGSYDKDFKFSLYFVSNNNWNDEDGFDWSNKPVFTSDDFISSITGTIGDPQWFTWDILPNANVTMEDIDNAIKSGFVSFVLQNETGKPSFFSDFQSSEYGNADFRPQLVINPEPLVSCLEITTAPVPEPSSIVLGLMGLGSMLGFRRRK